MQYNDDPLSLIYENIMTNQFASNKYGYNNPKPQTYELKGSPNRNNGLDQNIEFINSLSPIIREVWKNHGQLTDFVKHLREYYNIRYENLDVEIQRKIIKEWKEITGQLYPKMN
jgi:hypothetical protein